MMDLKSGYYHGVKCYHEFYQDEYIGELEVIKRKLESIFLCGYLLSRQDIINTERFNDFEYLANLSANDSIAFARHYSNITLEDSNERFVVRNKEKAYGIYPNDAISLYFGSDLDKMYQKVDRPRIFGESNFLGPIAIKDMKAITIPVSSLLAPFFPCEEREIPRILYRHDEFSIMQYRRLLLILDLMAEYNIEVPLLDIETGALYNPGPQLELRLRKSLK